MTRDPWRNAWPVRDRFTRACDYLVYSAIAGAALVGVITWLR